MSRAWHHRAVRPRVILLAICGIAALVYAAGNALDDAAMGRQAGAVAFGALAGYVALAGRGLPPRVRWPLLGSLLVLALGFAVGALLLQAAGPPRSYGFFTYHPLPRPHRASLVRAFGRGLSTMAVPLLAYPALAVAVSGLPHQRRRGLLLAGPVAAAALLGWFAVQVASADRDGGFHAAPTVPEALAMVGAPLLVALVAIGAGAVATQRVQGRLITVGFALTALSTLYALELSRYSPLVFDEVAAAVGVAPAETVIETAMRWLSGVSLVGDYGAGEVLPPVLAVAQVLGAALVAVGCVRARPVPVAGSAAAEADDPGGDLAP